MAHRLSRNVVYISKNEENIAHTEVFTYVKTMFSKDIFRNDHGTRPPRSLTLFPNKHRFPCNSYGQHHHINNVKIWKPSGTPLSTSASAWMFHKFLPSVNIPSLCWRLLPVSPASAKQGDRDCNFLFRQNVCTSGSSSSRRKQQQQQQQEEEEAAAEGSRSRSSGRRQQQQQQEAAATGSSSRRQQQGAASKQQASRKQAESSNQRLPRWKNNEI